MPNDDISMNSLHNGIHCTTEKGGMLLMNLPAKHQHVFCTPYVLESERKLQRLQLPLDSLKVENFLLDKIQNTPNEKEEFIVVGLASTLVAVELPSVTPRVDISYTALDVLRLSAVISWIS